MSQAPQDAGVLALVDERLAATPSATAVVADGTAWTYAELDALSRAHAADLVRAGAGQEDVVAVVAERGPRYVAAVLGVLRAGAAFLPVEPGTPVRRARGMCAAARVRTLIAEPGHEAQATKIATEIAAGAAGPPAVLTAAPGPAFAGTVARHPDGLAYVIFTSGSTGTPKGAMVTDGGMANHVAAKIADLGLVTGDVVGLTAPLSFDISVWQALTPLAAGGRVAVASTANLAEPVELVGWLRRHGVTVLELVPSFLAVLLDELAADAGLRAGLASLRQSGAFEGKLTGIIAETGAALSAKQTVAAAQTSIRDGAVSARDAVSGVNLDDEAVNLLRFQQAYQASSRVIQVARETLQSILDIH